MSLTQLEIDQLGYWRCLRSQRSDLRVALSRIEDVVFCELCEGGHDRDIEVKVGSGKYHIGAICKAECRSEFSGSCLALTGLSCRPSRRPSWPSTLK